MAIPVEASWGDLAAGMNLKALADAGADLALTGARAHQGHTNRMAQLGESIGGAWANLLVSNDAREAAANRATLTGRESQNVAESGLLVGTLAKIFDRIPPAGS